MKRKWLYILIFLPTFYSCLESPEMTIGIVNGKEKPTVQTVKTNPSPNDDGNLFFQGEVTSIGKAEITEKGFFWSTISNDPNINDNVIISDANSDIFTCELQSASGGKTYYWRAYAKNSYGIEYGEVNSYESLPIWEKKDSLNGRSRGKGAIFILNNNIYMICGEYKLEGGYSLVENDAWEYNIIIDRWNQLEDKQSFPGIGRINPVAFTIGDLAFVGTGTGVVGVATVVVYKDFFQYDGISNSWAKIAVPDDLEARYEAVAFSLNGKGYIIGGLSENRNALKDVWQYDPENGLWERKNDFPEGFYGGISISDNNRVFAGLSYAPLSEYRRILLEYNKETDNWEKFTTLPDDVAIYGNVISGVIVQNFIYIVDNNNIIWTLNMNDETKTWKKKTALPPDLILTNEEDESESGFQLLLTTGRSNSIYVGLGYNKYLYEYRPLWDN